jgi:amidohydrolase
MRRRLTNAPHRSRRPFMNTWQSELLAAVARYTPRMIQVRRHLHAHPEPSGEEFQSSLDLYQWLDAEGFAVRLGPEGRGVLADSPQAHRARIALRADIDALRIQDAKTVDYRSCRDGVMHACGHDAHAASVLGAVLALRDLERSGALPWPVAWRAVFQPAEETSAGALDMIRAGALDDVVAILGLHMDPSRDAGHIGLRAGPLTASCDELRIEIHGRGGHAARPHESADPIAAAAQLISTIYQFIPRVTDSQDAVVVTIGQIHAGDNFNVIPERAALSGTLRSLDETVRRRTLDHLRALAAGVGLTTQTEIALEVRPGPPSVNNDPQLVALVRRSAVETLGPEAVEEIVRPSMGGDDFAFYLQHVRGMMVRIGCARPGEPRVPLHSPHFDIDEQALPAAAALLAHAVISGCGPDQEPVLRPPGVRQRCAGEAQAEAYSPDRPRLAGS